MIYSKTFVQTSKYLKIGTCPASQKLLSYMGNFLISTRQAKFSLALQPEALVNTSGGVLFSSPACKTATLKKAQIVFQDQ